MASATAVGWKLISSNLDSDWLVAFHLIELLRTPFTHRHYVSARHRGDAQADGRLAIVPEQAARRIFIATLDRRDISK